jgi:hypothetical protein
MGMDFLNLMLRFVYLLELIRRITQSITEPVSFFATTFARNIFRPEKYLPSYAEYYQKSYASLRNNSVTVRF